MSIEVNRLDYIVGKTPTKIDYSEMSKAFGDNEDWNNF